MLKTRRQQRKKKKEPLFLFYHHIGARAVRRDGRYTWYVFPGPPRHQRAAEVKDAATILPLAVKACLDQNGQTLKERR